MCCLVFGFFLLKKYLWDSFKLLQSGQHIPLYRWVIFRCSPGPQFASLVPHGWIFEWTPFGAVNEYDPYEHSCTNVFTDICSYFSWVSTQEWDCWVVGWPYFNFGTNFQTISQSGHAIWYSCLTFESWAPGQGHQNATSWLFVPGSILAPANTKLSSPAFPSILPISGSLPVKFLFAQSKNFIQVIQHPAHGRFSMNCSGSSFSSRESNKSWVTGTLCVGEGDQVQKNRMGRVPRYLVLQFDCEVSPKAQAWDNVRGFGGEMVRLREP